LANIKFYLKSQKPDKNGEISIIAQISFEYKKYRRTIEKTKKRYWNPKKQRVIPPRLNEPDNRYLSINSLLDKYESSTKEFFNDCLRDRIEVDEELINEFLDKGKITKQVKLSFFEAFEEFLRYKGIDSAERSIKGYRTTRNFMKDFEKDMGYKIKFSSINMKFFDEFKLYSFGYRNISDNYFAKNIAVLKTFLNWAIERNYTDSYAHMKFSAAEREKEVIYLNINELLHLFNYDFENDRLNRARDIYCFGCFTGLRISDIQQLTRDHIVDGQIVKKIQKTKKFETIPINKYAAQILDKYKGSYKALPRLSTQKANKYIKECCKQADIDAPTAIIEYRGGKINEITKPKYKFITMHTARKTFITNSLILGMNVKTIKDITGHKKDNTFNKYLKIAEDYKKAEMDRAWNSI
jgi:integrase